MHSKKKKTVRIAGANASIPFLVDARLLWPCATLTLLPVVTLQAGLAG